MERHQLLTLQRTPSSALPAGKPGARINMSPLRIRWGHPKVVGSGAASVLVVLAYPATGALLFPFPGPGASERERWLLPQDILRVS